MPTDEQRMREQFEKWFTDIVLRRISEPGQWFEQDDVGGYIDPTVHDMWRGYVAGEQARDTEVQRLVAALTSMVVEFDPNSENEIAAHENAVMLLAEYLPEKKVADAD